MLGTNLLLVLELILCLCRTVAGPGVTFTGKPVLKGPNRIGNKLRIPAKRTHIESPIVNEDNNENLPKKTKRGEIKFQNKEVNTNLVARNKSNSQTLAGVKMDKVNVSVPFEAKDLGSLGSAKRTDIVLPEDHMLGKNDETMVVIDEEADDDTHTDTIKETPDEPEGYMIVLDNSVSHNANEEKNNRSLTELSKSFNDMDSKLKSIIQKEKKRHGDIYSSDNTEKRGDLKTVLNTNSNLASKEDFDVLEDSRFQELQKRLKEEGSDDEFIKLIKESDTNDSNGKSSKLVVETEDSGQLLPPEKEPETVRAVGKKNIPNPDPLDRFNQEQKFPIISEPENSGQVMKIREANTGKGVRKAALPLTNPHPTASVPIKGVPLTPGKRNVTDIQQIKVPSEDINSNSLPSRSVNEVDRQRQKKTGVAASDAEVATITTKMKPTLPASTFAHHSQPTSSITLDQGHKSGDNETVETAKRTTPKVEQTGKPPPVIAISYETTRKPSMTYKPKIPQEGHTANESTKREEFETPSTKNLSAIKITITPDSLTSDDDEDEAAATQNKQIIDPWKAQTMLEYINKDPLEVWIYVYKNLRMLGLNSTMLRNGLVNAGSIDRIKSAMKRALKGEDITLSIVGGSISAGGGLYKDRGNIDGLYYKGLADWWNKAITPLTGSSMIINNVAIGSIGTDYFSYCVKNHIVNETDLVLWELSGNDYNRYVTLPTKGAKPLERLTRMILQLPKQPALMYVNFFKGIDYKVSKTTCPNFEDQGEDIIAHYYKLPSLSWRSMVCEPLLQHQQLFTLRTLFSNDQYHPSLRAHAQMSLLLILHLRHVMRSVLKWAADHSGTIADFANNYLIPPPLFVGLEHPKPLCWTLITPDLKERITNSLHVKVLQESSFKLDYATNFPVRYDRVICWKAEEPGSEIKLGFEIPPKSKTSTKEGEKSEVAITTHTRWFGSAEVWLDDRPESPPVIEEGRKGDTGRRTQVDVVAKDVEPGEHVLTVRAKSLGFCLSAIMVY